MNRGLYWALSLALVLLALGLRLGGQLQQSLWADEISSILFAREGLARLLAATAQGEPHPPLYYLLLGGWASLASEGEVALRFPSLFFGVLTVPLLVQLGRLLLGWRAGLAAGLLAALSPTYLWHSQEARMYAPYLFFTVASLYFFLSLVTKERGGRGEKPLWAAYVVSSALMLYFHYFGVFTLMVEAAWLLALGRAARSRLRVWAAMAAVVLLFLPWLVAARSTVASYRAMVGSPVSPGEMLRQIGVIFSVGYTHDRLSDLGGNPLVIGVFSLVLALGVVSLLPIWGVAPSREGPALGGSSLPRGWFPLAFLASLLLLPFVAALVASQSRGFFSARYLLGMTPGYYLLLAAGIATVISGWDGLRALRIMGAAVLLGLLVPLGLSIRDYGSDPKYGRDDFRSAARYLEEKEKEGDVLVINMPIAEPLLRFYYSGALPVVGLPETVPLDGPATAEQLDSLRLSYQRVWLLLWHDYATDPRGFIPSWLRSHAFEEEQVTLPWIRLYRFATRSKVQEADLRIQNRLDLRFGDAIALLGYDAEAEERGEMLMVKITAYWKSLRRTPADYTVFVHLIREDGQIIAQADSQPAHGARPTYAWLEGEVVIDPHEIAVPLSRLSEVRQLRLGLYELATMKRLPLRDTAGRALGDSLVLPATWATDRH